MKSLRKKTTPASKPVKTWSTAVQALWRNHEPGSSTSDAIYGALRRAIVDGTIPAGERLAENHLAGLFKRSRTPIREAILRLESERLAVYVPRQGLVVATIGREEILDIYAVREMLDGLAARLAAQAASPTDLDHLTWLSSRVRTAVDHGDFSNVLALSLEFHEAVCRVGRNTMLLHFMQQIHDRVRRFRGSTLTYPGRSLEAVEEHDALLEAIGRRDSEAAERIARSHINRAMQLRIAMQQATPASPVTGLPETRRGAGIDG